MNKPNIDRWKFDVDDIYWIEHSLKYRLGRLVQRRETVKKENSKTMIDTEIDIIREVLGKIHNQKHFYRPSKGIYVSG
jgi:hypothetical protein